MLSVPAYPCRALDPIRKENHVKLKALLLTLTTSLFFVSFTVVTAELPPSPHISTSGSAVIQAQPDMATLNINVEVKEQDAVTAKNQVDKSVSEYFEFLKEQGLNKKDIEAANINVNPNYEYDKQRKTSVIRGYNASRRVKVKIHDLTKLNKLLDGALQKGLNDIQSIQFGVGTPEKYRTEVRHKAIKTAISQAKDVAKGFGMELGPLYSINYNTPQATPSLTRSKLMMMSTEPMGERTEETYEQQTIDFSDQVDVVYGLREP